MFIESTLFGACDITLQLAGGGAAKQSVVGNAGAPFFGETGLAVTRFAVSADANALRFAFGQFFEGNTAPLPGPEPEPGCSALMLAGLAASGCVARRHKAGNV